MNPELVVPLVSYMLGAIPFGYIVVRVFQKSDIRASGSGNIGATNVFRKSRWAGILTLLLDGGKGYLAVVLAAGLGANREWQAIAALFAILGHVFTVFLGFKGGKGVATGCGAYLALSPPAVLTTLAVFVATVVLSRYISLASILATGAFPLWAWLYGEPRALVAWAALGAGIIIAKHHQNIRRLLGGRENRFSTGKSS
jgi:acyl phosphate:glycerol-3-phosphate acyltransferase